MLPKALDIWLPGYLSGFGHRAKTAWAARTAAPARVFLCVCDHFEPFHDADKPAALARVRRWSDRLPELADRFRGHDGVGFRHTFFYPVEQWDDDVLGALGDVCRRSGAEVEIHLHHRRDTAAGLTATLATAKRQLAAGGFLGRDPAGAHRFGFIHGNWALDDSHPRGDHCGVRDELRVLRQTGCYADFTMPSAPDRCQTRTLNSIYYATDTAAAKSHDRGVAARVGRPPDGDLLLVQGPLGLNWRWRKWGFLPRLENGDLTGANPPTPGRFGLWRRLAIGVAGRPEWQFVKLHTHGAIPRNSAMFLGEPLARFLAWLATQPVAVHYVTARELVNLVHAAEDGAADDPAACRDYRYRRPAIASP